jgi:hypothetical protein
MRDHGFSIAADPEYCTRDYDWEWWFERSRAGSPFLVELIAFQFALPRFRHPVTSLHVTCYGANQRVSYLREHGLASNAAGYYPYIYLRDVVDRPYVGDSVGVIDLTDPATWDESFRALGTELSEIDPGIWDHLGTMVH